ncbi:MAG: prepilin-type N-terminal cleavage/methylation domain-containing protein [Patescibacteria group bacterium]
MILKIGNSCSFTLIELMIVVSILLVMTVISLPLFSKTFDNIALENYAKDIVHLMRFVQLKAISENNDYRINFNNNKFILEKKEGNDYKNVLERLSNIKKISEKIIINSSPSYIFFRANGQIHSFNITLSSKSNKTISILNDSELFNAKIK